MPGVVETLRFLYELDVADHATKPLLAAHRAEEKATKQTDAMLRRQDLARKRSATVAASTAAQVKRTATGSVQAIERETAAMRRNAIAQERAMATRRRAAASEQSIVRRAAGSARGSAKGAIGGIAAIASVATAKQAVNVTIELAKTTSALNKNLGIGVEQASRWAAVARTRNVDSKALNQSFVVLSKNMGAAGREQDKYRTKLQALGNSEKDHEKRQKLTAKGAGDTSAAFRKLGISQNELERSDFDTVLKKAADGLNAMPPSAKRAELSAKLFGRGWQSIVPILRGGSKAMDEQLRLADKYGVTLNGKAVKSAMALAAAQREMQMATMGLQIAFATQLVPTLTKVINKGSEFVAQMRSGEGAGGRFAKQASQVANDLRPVAAALQSVGGFLVDHPHLVLAAAGAYVAFKTARGTLKILKDLRDMKTAIVAVRTAAAKSGAITTLMAAAGRRGGAAAAEGIASSAGAGLGPALDRHQKKFTGGRWSRLGGLAGRAFGIAAVGAAAIEFSNWAGKKIKDWLGLEGSKLSRLPGTVAGGSPWEAFKSLLPGGRRGGIVGRFQGGGLVPILASGGEVMVHGGRAAMIPGPSNRDATPMLAPAGAAILTGSGQAMVAGGASLADAVRHQAPHFAKGGVVPGKYTATSYGPPWGGMQGTGITKTGVNLKDNPHLYGIATDPRMIPLGSKVFAYPNPFGYSGRFSAFDTGSAIKGRRVDFYDWRGRARQNAWGRRPVTISRSRIAPRQEGEDTYRAPGGGAAETSVRMLGRDKTRGGLLGDAFAQGRALGQSGATLSDLARTGNPVTKAIKEALAGAGTQPDKGGTSHKAAVDVLSDTGGFASGGRLARMYAKASAINAKGYQYAWGGGHGPIGVPSVGTRTARGGPRGLGYDCSGAVSAVLGAGGLLKAPLTSGQLMGWGRKGSSQNLAVYADSRHTIMRIGGRYFGTGEANPGGGAGWLPSNTMKGRGVVRTSAARSGFRAGGIVGRYRTGGTISGAGSALSGGLSRAMSFAGGSFDALDQIIERAAAARLGALRRVVEARVKRGGPARVVERLQGVLDMIDKTIGFRVGRIEDAVDKRTAMLERGRGATDRIMRMAGISPDSSQGIAALRGTERVATTWLQENVTSLERALRTAGKARNQEAIREITGKLEEAQDALAESLVRQAELARDAIRAAARERSEWAGFGLSEAQSVMSGLEADQRLAQTHDTAGGMRQRAGYIGGAVIPRIQATIDAANAAAASAVDIEGWRAAMQEAWSATVDLKTAQADAADLIREAAEREAEERRDAVRREGEDRVKGAQFELSWRQNNVSQMEASQRLAGVSDTPAGMRQRASYLKGEVSSRIRDTIAAYKFNADKLWSIGDVDGWRQAMLDAQGATTDLANAQADAADLMRQAAARAAAEPVDIATHRSTLAGIELRKLELEQQLVGTFDSTGGAQGRAELIRTKIIPAITTEIGALRTQEAAAKKAGDAALARQIGEAIADRQNDILQAQLDAQKQTAENTELLKEFGGSTAFGFRDQPYTDGLDVIAARAGA